ncbi:hypothetical protein [Trichocoleus sp. FACHB-262]|uniref:hypothetical protein n=1 Tax=Trichocoleus sp. FACHB-262 TaxID=2692869 RepID=UPI0016887A4B|nr:hypothetical protein [Trichocoleus sp. FACHB-262]MBD2119303.1 hypothetical protein [Trichocoleus sp. FACHB-262]
MNILSDSVLVGSKSARDNHLVRLNHDCATEILSKVKLLCFSVWRGVGLATTNPGAEFHEALSDTACSAVKVKFHRLCPVVTAGGFTVEVLISQGKSIRNDTSSPSAQAAIEADMHFINNWLSGFVTSLICGALYEQGHIDQKEYRCLSDAIGEAV